MEDAGKLKRDAKFAVDDIQIKLRELLEIVGELVDEVGALERKVESLLSDDE